MTYLGYLAVCPVAYLCAGSIKFAINTLRARKLAFDQMGLGGIPSTHTSIVSAPAWLIAFREGIDAPAMSVAIALLMIVAIDAMDLRRKVGKLNQLVKSMNPQDPVADALRDRMGHTPIQVLAGLCVGALAAGIVGFF